MAIFSDLDSDLEVSWNADDMKQLKITLVPLYRWLGDIPIQWHLLKPLANKPFENTVEKGEIVRNEQFLLSPQYFLPI